MAYETSNPIKKIAGGVGGAIGVWSYEDGDNLAVIDGSGYFNAESARLKVGDRIKAVAGDGYGTFVVVSNSNGVVDVANANVEGAVDSD